MSHGDAPSPFPWEPFSLDVPSFPLTKPLASRPGNLINCVYRLGLFGSDVKLNENITLVSVNYVLSLIFCS